ncbi:hypothetical protein Esi_0010_0156 [Ectocarpus siliculosus]|uniref:Uncharacterized protein n=1 Tax=Ectocarpus siliculosus TaxID=2880 RepID=D8LC40_ECTSI|nr:hypothetical protein Esi_0010_0156 [Ectocarpus siliculosus]|eukprot:CBN79223.1 hypothetical protein Esi_0010_0156 [Ectocarpus siliculosus]
MSDDEQAQDGKGASSAGKRTRVEGRGSSAAQRAAASEACKSISLKRLQEQYHRPLSDDIFKTPGAANPKYLGYASEPPLELTTGAHLDPALYMQY